MGVMTGKGLISELSDGGSGSGTVPSGSASAGGPVQTPIANKITAQPTAPAPRRILSLIITIAPILPKPAGAISVPSLNRFRRRR
ncbi:hypothetical protein TUM20985_39530 [Mycobacterium antarcticum]|nr:hypothetical protein TUM20985_39530 [Mycolicibacterium sp. TUM20985]GLP82980.1 hypothetical protein TUM20984_44000 [Mycolicibacterium sp. TUM20984]